MSKSTNQTRRKQETFHGANHSLNLKVLRQPMSMLAIPHLNTLLKFCSIWAFLCTKMAIQLKSWRIHSSALKKCLIHWKGTPNCGTIWLWPWSRWIGRSKRALCPKTSTIQTFLSRSLDLPPLVLTNLRSVKPKTAWSVFNLCRREISYLLFTLRCKKERTI